jgi:hypothetical protein
MLLAVCCMVGCASFDAAVSEAMADAMRPQLGAASSLMQATMLYYDQHGAWPETKDELLKSQPSFPEMNYSKLVFVPNDNGSLTVEYSVANQPENMQRMTMGQPRTTEE